MQSGKAYNNISKYLSVYKNELFNNVVLFWEKYSLDKKYGGYLTCLDRQGNVYDTDKFMWLQARQLWLFSMLCNQYERKEIWLDIARCGADFLVKNGMDEWGKWYFALDRQGKPLIQPYNIYSDCFAAMAFCEYGFAADNQAAKDLALRTYNNIMLREHNPKGIYNKVVAATRSLKSLSMPMMKSMMTLELEPLLDHQNFEQALISCVHEIMEVHFDKNSQLIFENVLPDGSHLDCFEGRLINPGHGIEAMWVMIDIGRRKNDKQLINKAADIILSSLDYSWDKKNGGIFYFLDAYGKPPLQLEWDQKLWWVHLETLVALLKAYVSTGRAEFHHWFERVHTYTWEHFPDSEYGEWFGYLNRRGGILLDLKGGKFKGCFHVPRALFQCFEELRQCS